jgi:U3 small nucleolar RNA-associated protein 4
MVYSGNDVVESYGGSFGALSIDHHPQKQKMVEVVRRSRRIQSQSDDEASVTPSSSTKEVTASTTRPRRATKDSSGKKTASTAKGKKELMMEAIPEIILGSSGTTNDAAVVTTTVIPKAKSDRKKRNINSSSTTSDDLSSNVEDEQVVEVPKKKNKIVDKEVVNKEEKKKGVTTTTTTDISSTEKKQRKSSSVAVEVASASTRKSKDKKSSTKKKDTPNPTPNTASAVVNPNEGTDGLTAETSNNLQPSKNKLKRMRQSLPEDPQAVVTTAKTSEKNDTAQDATPSKNPKKEKKMNDGTPDKESIPEDEPLATNITSPTESSQTSKTKKSSSRKNKKSSHHKKEQKSIKYAKPSVSPSPKLHNPTSSDKSLPLLSAVVPKEKSSIIKSSKLIMDVKVHRLRFLKLHPRSILSMASTTTTTSIHFPTITNNSSYNETQQQRHPARLAISREGGSVELLSPQDRWVTIGHIPGVRGREVDAMVWIYGGHRRDNDVDDNNTSNDNVSGTTKQHQFHRIRHIDEQLRLFGCSRDGTIFELDFATKRQTNVIGSGGGGVFCLSTMCYRGRSTKADSVESFGDGYFAAGCEDGTIKIYDAFGSNGGGVVSGLPTLAATLPSAGSAILSMAWLPGPNGNGGGMGGSAIFAAVADGTIRRFDCVTSIVTGPISTGSIIAPAKGTISISYRWKSTLRMTVENRGLRQSTKVWALQALSDGTVISGDSLGHIQIWDGMSGTMTQTFDHNESGADVLCLAVSEDETKIFASGIDSSVRCIQRKSSTSNDEGLSKWISSNSHRKHSHDVKALAICHKEVHNSSNPLELLVSGSVDTRICSYVVRDFKSIRPKIWYNWPSLSPISVSRAQRLIAVTRDNRIDVYRLADDCTRTVGLPETRDESKCLVKTIAIQSPFNLNCSVISDDGKFLAASDAVSLYVFSLVVEDDGGILDVRPTKISLSGDCKHPATALRFVKGHLICATNIGPINVLAISSDKVVLKHVFKEHMMDWSATSHHFPIVSLDVCSDGKWLAARRFSSEKGAVHVFKLPINDDGSYQHWWALPQMDAPTTCIKFLGGGGSSESSLAVGCSNNEFYIYNLDRRSLSHWSNDMGVPCLKKLPKELSSRSEPVTRIVSSPSSPQRFILVGVDDSRCLRI